MPAGVAVIRQARRGGALATSLLFMVMITVAGSALLAIALINRVAIINNSIDVRVTIAAEAGIETMRGRFTLIQGVQEDWDWLGLDSWINVGSPIVNGIPVDVEARAIGGPSVPTARVRALAKASGRTRVVEYLIKVATFSDYAVFTGETADLGPDYKAVGNVYVNGQINIPNNGAQMLGDVTVTGSINKTNSDDDSYTFPLTNPLENQPAIPFPTWAAPWEALENVGRTMNHIYAENTIEIILTGSTYTRIWVQRNDNNGGTGTVPTGLGWINRATGVTDYDESGNGLRNSDYRVIRQDDIPLPEEGVIYVKSGPARLNGPGGADTLSKDTDKPGNVNNFTQTRVTGSSGDDMIFYDNYFSRTTPVLLLSGYLTNARVSIACDHKIIIRNPIAYSTLLANPGYRRFWADGINGKESAGALAFTEMLGVMAKGDIHSAVTWWNSSVSLGPTQLVTDMTGEYIPGHYSNPADGGQYAQDGVYMSLGATRPYRHSTGTPLGEMWFHGGLIAQGRYGSGNAPTFKRRNYDWDYRMRLTCPPYFLRAYNSSAVFIPGTWRTYEL